MKRHRKTALLCGMLGCICYGSGDWLMLYGDPAHAGALFWLTKGAAQIPQWRYDLAMALAFPGIILYGYRHDFRHPPALARPAQARHHRG